VPVGRADRVRREAAVLGPALENGAVDGNAIGGLLMSLFGAEMTAASGECGSCGTVSQVAELAVYHSDHGTVVRCRVCEAVLMVFVEVRGVTCVDLEGLASLA
jgi:Family of unknown function (DUF6510)